LADALNLCVLNLIFFAVEGLNQNGELKFWRSGVSLLGGGTVQAPVSARSPTREFQQGNGRFQSGKLEVLVRVSQSCRL